MAYSNGMFSRRHQTNGPHLAAKAQKEADTAEQLEAASERFNAARARSAHAQIKRLDDMLGKGKGAVKERARLATKIESLKAGDKQKAHKEANRQKKTAKSS